LGRTAEDLEELRPVATDTNLLDDDRIGGYRFIRMVHAGQNTTVMEVLQESTGRRFVMKQLLASRTGSASERKAFDHEAKLGLTLRHPNLIQVHDYVRSRDQPYFVMDYFPSVHLGLVVAKPDKYGLAPGIMHSVIRQAGAGLAYLHDRKWVHRDIKPANIIVSKGGDARLIDYALAMRPFSVFHKLLKIKPPRQGTYSYMSPEQIRCEPPEFAADIYSFGITCYELACGRQPFRANSPTELLGKHLREQPSPPTVHNKKITPEFSDLVMSMLRKRPADRLGSMHELLSRFSRIRIFAGDPDPQADREAF